MLELAQLYLTLDDVDACQQQCSVILKRDQFNEEASLVCCGCLFALLILAFFFLNRSYFLCFSLADGWNYVQEAGLWAGCSPLWRTPWAQTRCNRALFFIFCSKRFAANVNLHWWTEHTNVFLLLSDNYLTLSRLIDSLRRAGKLEEVPRFLDTAEKYSSRAKFDPGFNYCKGLYLW